MKPKKEQYIKDLISLRDDINTVLRFHEEKASASGGLIYKINSFIIGGKTKLLINKLIKEIEDSKTYSHYFEQPKN